MQLSQYNGISNNSPRRISIEVGHGLVVLLLLGCTDEFVPDEVQLGQGFRARKETTEPVEDGSIIQQEGLDAVQPEHLNEGNGESKNVPSAGATTDP
jgi:hypothetical protein